MLQNNTFLHRFLLDVSSFWPPKMERKFIVFRIFIDKADFVKIIVFARKIAIFLVLSLPKSTKFRCQNAFENDIAKKGSKIGFGHRFWGPKTTKIAPKSDAERSLFRDAMQLARKSSQINGYHSFGTTNMATHMIRSYLSIYLLICPSSP